jgi:hypothetical protein
LFFKQQREFESPEFLRRADYEENNGSHTEYIADVEMEV